MQESFFGLMRSTAKRELVVVGLPWDATSSYRRGAATGPDAMRRATSGRLYNRFTEQGLDLAALWKVCDHGNVKETSDISKLKKRIASAISLHDHTAIQLSSSEATTSLATLASA
jgi:agmatinase